MVASSSERRQQAGSRAERSAHAACRKSAIRTVDGRSVVFVVNDDRVERRAISVGLDERRSGRSAVRRLGGRARGRRRPANAEGRRQGEGAMMSNALVTVRDLHKVFQRGGERIDVLQGVNLDIPVGRFSGADGTVGLRQDDAAESAGRPRHPDRRLDRGGRRSHRQAVGRQAVAVARPPHRLRLPALQPAAGADRRAQRRAAAAPDQAVEGRAAQARAGGADRSSASPSG